MSDILRKVISVTSVEDKGKNVVVKDQDGKKFNVWVTKKDGTPSRASITMQELGVKTGSTVEVSYTEEDFELDGKSLKTKRVMSFSPTSGTPAPAAPRSSGQRGSVGSSPDWDAIATGKIASNLITAVVGKEGLSGIDEGRIALAFDVAARIMAHSKAASFEASIPTPPAREEDEISVEDVVF